MLQIIEQGWTVFIGQELIAVTVYLMVCDIELWALSDRTFVQGLQVNLGFFLRFNLFVFTEGKGERKKERNLNVWLSLVHPVLGTWPATQACALTGNQTGNPLVCWPVLNPLSPTSQGRHAVWMVLLVVVEFFQLSIICILKTHLL